MKSKALDKVLKYFREEAPVMSFSAGGGALYRGSAKNDSGSPTAGVDLRLKHPTRIARILSRDGEARNGSPVSNTWY